MSLSISTSLSLCLCLSMPLSLYIYICPSLYFCLCLYAFLFMSLSLYASLSVWLSLSLCLSSSVSTSWSTLSKVSFLFVFLTASKSDFCPQCLAWGYGIGFVTLVCIISNIGGLLTPVMSKPFFQRLLQFLVAMGAGTLSATGLLVLIPEV